MSRPAHTPLEPASAVLSRASGPDANGPLPSARLAAILAPANPPKLKFLDKLIAEQKEYDASRVRALTDSEEFSQLIRALNFAAELREWSQRRLAAKIGLPKSTWQRVCQANVNPAEWLPRLRTAAARLRTNVEGIESHGPIA